MDTDPAESGSHDHQGSSLIDVSGIPFDELVGSTNETLARALRSVTRDAADTSTILAAFQNFAPDDPTPF
jgi:FXSXX-COOH protein